LCLNENVVVVVVVIAAAVVVVSLFVLELKFDSIKSPLKERRSFNFSKNGCFKLKKSLEHIIIYQKLF
jgi:hypothetical protein